MKNIKERFEESISIAKQNGMTEEQEKRMKAIFFAGAGVFLEVMQQSAELENEQQGQLIFNQLCNEVYLALNEAAIDATLRSVSFFRVH